MCGERCEFVVLATNLATKKSDQQTTQANHSKCCPGSDGCARAIQLDPGVQDFDVAGAQIQYTEVNCWIVRFRDNTPQANPPSVCEVRELVIVEKDGGSEVCVTLSLIHISEPTRPY